MPDFSARAASIFSGAATLDLPPWTDPETVDQPSRLNLRADVHFRYYRVSGVGAFVCVLELHAIVGGVDAPADAALDGRLFTWENSLQPVIAPVPILTTPVGGFSSIARVALSGAYPGHYRVLCRRPSSGNIGIPFDVELRSS